MAIASILFLVYMLILPSHIVYVGLLLSIQLRSFHLPVKIHQYRLWKRHVKADAKQYNQCLTFVSLNQIALVSRMLEEDY